MPAPVRLLNSKRHNTNEEKAAREQEERKVQPEKLYRKKPECVLADELASRYWDKTLKALKSVALIESPDVDVLGTYCLALSRRDMLNEIIDGTPPGSECWLKLLGRLESTERNILAYARQLGLTPESRARLAVKRANKQPKDENEDLYG